MTIRLNKTTKIILAIVILILSVALGYLIWRINQPERLDPTDSDAAEGECEEGAEWYAAMGKGDKLYCIDNEWRETFPAGCYAKGACLGGTGWISKAAKSVVTCFDKEAECKEYFKEQITRCNDSGKHGFCASGNCDFSKTGRYSGWIYQCTDAPPPKPPVDCGEDLEPKSFAFNKANTDASKIGPFPEDGKVVFFFKSLLPDVAGGGPYRPKISFKVVSTDSTRNGQTYVYTPSADEERKETIFAIKEGEYLLLTDSDDNNNQGSPECAPTENNPKYKSFGWIAPSGGLCGSGLLGPPTEGNRVPYDKPSIAAFRSKSVSQGYKELPKGEQCWADWREWPGDYDFNDYFLMVSYATEPKSLLTADISVEKSAIESCINEETENPEAELVYSITITNKGGAAGTVSKVVDTLDSKVVAGSVSSISDSGSYSEGKITWNFTPALSLDANGGKKVLTYKVKVAKENFGEYKNVVVVTTSTGEVTAEYSIVADCIITTPDTPDKPGEKVPQTGLFDSVLSRIAAGVILVIFGVFVYNIPNTVFTFHHRKKKISYKYREKFEKRMTGN